MRIAVAGGTGLAGRGVVEALRGRGHEVVAVARVQPVAVREVADALAGLVVGEPRGMAPEMAGPRVESLVDMARRLIAAGGARRRPVLPVRMPGGMSGGGLLPTGAGPRGTQTFTDWLAEHTAATAAS